VDQISRDLQRPGEPVFIAMVDRWGDRILTADGTLDRGAVASLVFHDSNEMHALMAMTSSAIETVLLERIRPLEATSAVVLLEAALLRGRLYGIEGLLLVDAPEDVALARLIERRGMQEADARARMANQASREERLASEDFIIDNSEDDLHRLQSQVSAALNWLESLPDARFVPRMS